MFKYPTLLASLVCTLLCVQLGAQDQHSFISDKRFPNIQDILGYRFFPSVLEVPNDSEKNLPAGSFSFGITQSHLYVEGQGYQGVYNINNINTTEYGYILNIMNARSSMQTGHLKVILNDNYEVVALIFKRESKASEVIFHITDIRPGLAEKEEAYFTDIGDCLISDVDSLWGQTIRPFHVRFFKDGRQQRYLRSDSIRITFVKEVEVIEKEIKKKKKKKPEDKDEVADADLESLPDSLQLDTTAVALETDSVGVKTKIIETYSLIRKHKVHYNDGTFDYQEETLPIKRFKMREDEEASELEEKYQVVLTTSSGDELYIYLLGNHTVSSVDFLDRQYFMRGF